MPSLPRIPSLSAFRRRIAIPADLEAVTSVGAEEEPGAGGITEGAVERIWADAVSLYRSGVHPAVQVCIRREGAVVLDRAIGHARGNGPDDDAQTAKAEVTPDTPFCVYSASKAITAFVVHMLGERGMLDIDEPVATYIPEYARHGKEGITIGHVLAHRAGVPNLPREAMDLSRMGDREYLTGLLCDAKPIAAPGRLLAYHAVSGGFILGEIVHRVAGKDIRDVLSEEILEPLGFRWMRYGVAESDLGLVARDYVTGPPLLPPFSTLLTRALGSPLDNVVEAANDPRFLTGIVPAGNVVTNANEISRFYELMRMGGELDGVRVMEPKTIQRALTQQSHLEIDLSLVFPTRFSYGLMLGAQVVSLYGRDTQHAFGHLGFTNILTWADPERALAAAVLTNGKPALYPEFPRFYGLCQRITTEAKKIPASALHV